MKTLAVATGILAGLGIFATTFYVWMIWGADPNKDSMFSC